VEGRSQQRAHFTTYPFTLRASSVAAQSSDFYVSIYVNKKAMLSQGNRAMPL